MSNDAETEADEEAADDGGLQDGDFIELDYTARTVEGGDLVDTTSQEVADEEGVGEDQEFGPRTLVLGQGHLFEAVEDDIIGKEAGDSGSVVVPATEAFGEYDETEVRTITKDKIPEDDRYPGARVDVDGQHGHVETIVGGRARVDFNHPLADQDVEYEYEILREVEDREERAQGVLSMMLDVDLDIRFETDVVEEEQVVEPDDEAETDEDEASDEDDGDADDEEASDEEGADGDAEPETETVEVEKETLYIEAVPQLTMNQQWMMGKQQIAQQLIDLLDVDRVIVQETLDGMGGLGMPGMMGGGGGGGDLEEMLEDEDLDADELADELEGAELDDVEE